MRAVQRPSCGFHPLIQYFTRSRKEASEGRGEENISSNSISGNFTLKRADPCNCPLKLYSQSKNARTSSTNWCPELTFWNLFFTFISHFPFFAVLPPPHHLFIKIKQNTKVPASGSFTVQFSAKKSNSPLDGEERGGLSSHQPIMSSPGRLTWGQRWKVKKIK